MLALEHSEHFEFGRIERIPFDRLQVLRLLQALGQIRDVDARLHADDYSKRLSNCEVSDTPRTRRRYRLSAPLDASAPPMEKGRSWGARCTSR